ncbi:MAG: DUF4012 domain-containing protein [Candidatus Moraniibacteriota bacterium]
MDKPKVESKNKLKTLIANKKFKVLLIILAILIAGFFVFSYLMKNKQLVLKTSLSALDSVSRFLPIPADEKKEIEVLNTIVSTFTKNDDKEKTFLILLQNNTELRPGGGFLGQYAIVQIKNGNVVSTKVEDANLLDQRILAKVPTPYPFERMMQLKNWKFRDSNFSPDFPTNVEKAEYFFRLAGGNSKQFDGVVAVNSQVFDNLFTLTGPISVPGYTGEFNSENASRRLEEIVEKAYIMNPSLDTQNRKAILKTMAPIILQKLLTLGNVTKIADLFHNEMKNRNVMLNFTDQNLQQVVASVHWDGTMPKDWAGDYLMAVDANMGALKTDFYMRREMNYDLDFTQEKPTVTLNVKYKNTAPSGDWRTSDYHAYLRTYVPQGATFVSSHMVSHINTANEFGKTYFGFKVDVVMGTEVDGQIIYTLPDSITPDNYKLLIQKQSGAGSVPVTVRVKMKDGKQYTQQQTLLNDLNLQYNN